MKEIYNFLVSNQFLNSSFFIASTTLFVGFGAYFLYKRQKRDEKKDAATVLIAEIKNATTLLPGIKARFKKSLGKLEEGTVLMPSDSWSKYKFLFVNDLKDEEWRAVDIFYKNCIAYDAALIEKQSYFAQNTGQIWVSIHKNYCDMLQDFFKKNPDLETTLDKNGNTVLVTDAVKKRIDAFTDTYIANSGLASYDPIKPQNDVERALGEINDDLLLSSVGNALEKIANSKIIRFL